MNNNILFMNSNHLAFMCAVSSPSSHLHGLYGLDELQSEEVGS